MGYTTIKVFFDGSTLSRYAADYFRELASQAVLARGRFLVALSGGNTPTALYRSLAMTPHLEAMAWEKMLFFWGDERCVPADDPESSYHQARMALLELVPVPEDNVHRVRGELDPQAACEDYNRQLRESADDGKAWPRFDLVLLGLGADGHTASLFPGSSEPGGTACVPVTGHYQDRPSRRVSLTSDVFNAARNVVFLVTGVEKAEALAATLAGPKEPTKYPAQRINPADGNILWLVDAAAASKLPNSIEAVRVHH